MKRESTEEFIVRDPSKLMDDWLRRLWPFYCLLAALATFGYALYDRYQVDGDAVAYMDIGDLIRSHQWAGVVNAYWNPLYPAVLSTARAALHTTRFTELHAYYLANFAVFIFEMLAVIAFCDAVIRLRTVAEVKSDREHLLGAYGIRYIGVGLIVIAAQRELSMGKVRPDALLTALLLLGLAFLLNYLASGLLRYASLMGVALGLAYLTKSFAFVFGLLCILTMFAFACLLRRRTLVHNLIAAGVALLFFAVVTGPYIAALSKQKGHFDFGDSGSLNYAWYVGGTEKMHLQPDEQSKFGSAEVHLKHPERELSSNPPIFSYKELPFGTYPDWFDTTYWNDRVKPHMNLRGEISKSVRDVILLLRYLLNHPEGLILLALLAAMGAGRCTGWRSVPTAFWFVPCLLGLCIWCIYGMVNIEERYVTVGYLAILLPLLAALHSRPAQSMTRPGSSHDIVSTASALALLFAFLAVGESVRVVLEQRRQLVVVGSPGGWYDAEIFETAKALNKIGVGPGDTIACVGGRACLYDHYWARLAGVRILTEIYAPSEDVYRFLDTLGDRADAFHVVQQQGAKVLVGYFTQPGEMTGTTPVSVGWNELGDTHFFAYPLNPAASGEVPAKSVNAPTH